MFAKIITSEMNLAYVEESAQHKILFGMPKLGLVNVFMDTKSGLRVFHVNHYLVIAKRIKFLLMEIANVILILF